jgi:GTPase SAR1 family protein
MELFDTLHSDVLNINKDLHSLVNKGKKIPEMSDSSFAIWEKTCQSTEKQLSEEILHVAVVGAVKSGKSTFTNLLFKGDYVKRGAGIVTSIVTRVRQGQSLEATLCFKSWDEVNQDIDQALRLLPLVNENPENNPFDIRDEKNRLNLERSLQALGPDALVTDGFRNANSVLLSSYLKGYDRVKSFVSSKPHDHRFRNGEFSKHLPFVGEDALAVYLKDVELEINTGDLASDIEIADCQGSDSPNPLHLAMIQDYLLFTHLIVYVVSSRTGLRQADIRFLTIIKKMGLLENIVFVVNCDFSEHETIASLNKLVTRIKEEISLIKTDPEIYCFSSLYHLFKLLKNPLSPRFFGKRVGAFSFCFLS